MEPRSWTTTPGLEARAAVHAALGDPLRLAIVESLVLNDRSPSEIAQELGIATNLLAHHLGILRNAGCIREAVSAGDRRRRYIQLVSETLEHLFVAPATDLGQVLFVCTHNSARSQIAAALYARATGTPALSAGTHPAARVNPSAVRTASRHGLEIGSAVPRSIEAIPQRPSFVITVCDQANEETAGRFPNRLHWSVPDPVLIGIDDAFEETYDTLEERIEVLTSAHRRSATPRR